MLLGDAAHINNPSGGMGRTVVSSMTLTAWRKSWRQFWLVAMMVIARCVQCRTTACGARSVQALQTAAIAIWHRAGNPGYRQHRNDTHRQMAADPATARAFLAAPHVGHRILARMRGDFEKPVLPNRGTMDTYGRFHQWPSRQHFRRQHSHSQSI